MNEGRVLGSTLAPSSNHFVGDTIHFALPLPSSCISFFIKPQAAAWLDRRIKAQTLRLAIIAGPNVSDASVKRLAD